MGLGVRILRRAGGVKTQFMERSDGRAQFLECVRLTPATCFCLRTDD